MKIADCNHYPKNPAKPRAGHCGGGDESRFGLRVCLACGYIGCCEDDPGQHAKKHMQDSSHQVIASYPADESSFIWCYAHNDYLEK